VLVRTCSAILASLTIAAAGACAASAASTGGAAAGTTPTSTPATPIHLSPVTAKTSNIAYKGPVYEKTATGEVIPYTPPATGTTTATTSTSTSTGVTAAGGATASAPATTPTGPEVKSELLVPGSLARYVNGQAAAPMNAPAVVQAVIWAGNELIGLPYIFGGGHASFISPGYDCSATVSFALHGGALLTAPEDSSEFERWGSHGAGRWIAIFSNPEHAYMTVAGLRLDTSAADDPSDQQGPRWRPLRQNNSGYTVRHPLGL
jgi:cell wall-associated NlpC family hydrolase